MWPSLSPSQPSCLALKAPELPLWHVQPWKRSLLIDSLLHVVQKAFCFLLEQQTLALCFFVAFAETQTAAPRFFSRPAPMSIGCVEAPYVESFPSSHLVVAFQTHPARGHRAPTTGQGAPLHSPSPEHHSQWWKLVLFGHVGYSLAYLSYKSLLEALASLVALALEWLRMSDSFNACPRFLRTLFAWNCCLRSKSK